MRAFLEADPDKLTNSHKARRRLAGPDALKVGANSRASGGWVLFASQTPLTRFVKKCLKLRQNGRRVSCLFRQCIVSKHNEAEAYCRQCFFLWSLLSQ
jgi:hypothetical protein